MAVVHVSLLDVSKAFHSVNHLGTGYGSGACAPSRYH